MNTSRTGGYLSPITPNPFPKRLNLTQFIQTVLAGITGLPGQLVRPEWQIAPPKQPDILTNWLAFKVVEGEAVAYSYVGMDAEGNTTSERQVSLHVTCSFYGPDAFENAAILRDGFQIQQNLTALREAKMGFTEAKRTIHLPDLVNERFVNRVIMEVVLQKCDQRSYPIVSLVSAAGTIHTVLGNETYLYDWAVPEET